MGSDTSNLQKVVCKVLKSRLVLSCVREREEEREGGRKGEREGRRKEGREEGRRRERERVGAETEIGDKLCCLLNSMGQRAEEEKK